VRSRVTRLRVRSAPPCGGRSWLTILAFVLFPALARAESKEADELFDQGKALMKDGKFADACPKLEQAEKMDPGVRNELWLADCYERIGRTASAFKQFILAEQRAVSLNDERDKVAHKRASALEPKLSKLVLVLPSTNRVEGIEVRSDGDVVKSFGDSITVDPGTHMVEATAPGYKHWESKVDVGGDGATVTATVGPLEKEMVVAPPPPLPQPVPHPSFWTPLRVAGLVTAGVGLVGVGLGTAFGVMAKSNLDDSNGNNHCDAQDTCDPQGLQLRSDAQTSALLSTISFVVGGVLVAGGVTMFLLGRPKEQHSAPAVFMPAVSPSFAGLAASGTF
jgi:hypothetical protein